MAKGSGSAGRGGKTDVYKVFDPNNANDAHGVFQPAYQDWAEGLTTQELFALRSYTSSGYYNTNNTLRKGDFDPTKFPKSAVTGTVTGMDSAIAKAPGLPQNTMLFRGLQNGEWFSAAKQGTLKKGAQLRDDGFVSTSPKRGTAQAFGTGGGNKVFMEIRAPKGTRGVYASFPKWNNYMHESEFVLPRGTRFKVESATMRKDGGYEYAHIVVSPIP